MNCLFHSCRNYETCQALQRSLHPSCRLTNFTRAKVRCKFRRLRSVTENLDAIQDIWPADVLAVVDFSNLLIVQVD